MAVDATNATATARSCLPLHTTHLHIHDERGGEAAAADHVLPHARKLGVSWHLAVLPGA